MFSALFSGSRRGVARGAATTLATGLVAAALLTAGAPTAVAADGTARTDGGATATLGGLKTYGAAVVHEEAGDLEVSAGLFEMSVDGGGTLQTYCVDLHNPTQQDARYHETPWSGTSLAANENAGKIRWILQNSYPQVNDLAALASKAGVRGVLTEEDAAAGTQVAIWRYSDDADVEALDPQAEQLADYLYRSARATAEPKASLSLEPAAVSGRSGELLGPVTVRTDASSVTVIPPVDVAADGVRVVDKDGEPVTTAGNGSELYFAVPEDAEPGSAELTVQASTTVPVGRAFTSDSRSQTQILAGSSESTVSASASATWAAQGAIPALSARKNCVKGGVDVTAVNEGDAPFTFEISGVEHTVPAGETQTVTLPVGEDQTYDFTIVGPGGLEKRFSGVLDCLTQGSDEAVRTLSGAGPSPLTQDIAPAGTNLAATGSSNATPIIAGVAIGLVVIGGAALVLVRKKKESAGE